MELVNAAVNRNNQPYNWIVTRNQRCVNSDIQNQLTAII